MCKSSSHLTNWYCFVLSVLLLLDVCADPLLQHGFAALEVAVELQNLGTNKIYSTGQLNSTQLNGCAPATTTTLVVNRAHSKRINGPNDLGIMLKLTSPPQFTHSYNSNFLTTIIEKRRKRTIAYCRWKLYCWILTKYIKKSKLFLPA